MNRLSLFRIHRRSPKWLFMTALAIGLGAGFSAGNEEVASNPAPPLFRRVVVLGASVGAGFDSAQPFGGPKTIEYRLANYLEAALIGTHEPVVTTASSLLFLSAEETLEKQVTATVAAKPSLIIGLDALFWFCYGALKTADERRARFEAGLRQLERIDTPLVVGDIPDASKAAGLMLGKEEMPELATIAQCNERLKAWAAAHRNVIVFPLARMMASATANEEFTLAGATWEKGKSRALLQGDQLHPSRHGLAALAIAVLEAAATTSAPSANLCRDLEVVYSAGIARTKAAATRVVK